ncbi:hypothetical protein QQS21_005396 [Conoideocrella luteorostrata]|uniref:NACHT domain-containing protein n=1 Tax=Conoideocrella luteorostrata TaxID=1105319 RepID=A0AAJ0FZ56_9HYPO|nr:hypothetical protein QQS21_005396 [Conoideocrella luteorostrata]
MSRPPKAELGLQILHECEEPNVDIVAVHGLGANPDYAWVWLPKNNPTNSRGYPDKPLNWLRELLPTKLSCRVLAFNYDSTWLSTGLAMAPQQRLSNISDNLLQSLQNIRETKPVTSRPLIFIGHSFGGNVIEQAIVSATRHGSEYLPIAESTVGVIFLGTPHRGSSAAQWGALIASLAPPGYVTTEDRLLKALEQQSDSLADRLRDFSQWLFSESVSVVCAFEQFATDYSSRAGFLGKLLPSKDLVVPESSACIDGHLKISLRTDHLKINKFYGLDDPSFNLIYPQIVRIAKNANEILNRRRNPAPIPMDERSTTSSDIRGCLQMMRVRNPEDILSDIHWQKGARLGNTCEWILKQDKFSLWSASNQSGFLRLIGSPGIGKTMISTFLVQELKTKVAKSLGKVFLFFFCDDKDQNRKTPTAILRSFIWQLLLQRNELFQHMQPDFKRHTNDRVFQDLFDNYSALWRIFQNMIRDKCAGQVFILIDALDECERSTRQILLRSIKNLYQPPLTPPSPTPPSPTQPSPTATTEKLKFLITCRPDIDDIEDELRSLDSALRIDSADINNDLSEYINTRVTELARTKSYTPQTKSKVIKALKRKAGGTFLWVSLMVAELSRPGIRMLHVEAKLQNLPYGLEDTYSAILDQVPIDNREIACFILRCMVAARRPLSKLEIHAAYATWKTGSVQCGEDLAVYADILSVCSSILYVGSGDNATLNFCHQSVKDFLLHKTSTSKAWYHSTEDEAHLHIFKVCWAFLSADEFDGGNLVIHRESGLLQWNRELPDLFSRYLFLEYSSGEWLSHAMASRRVLLRNWHNLAVDVTKAPTLRDVWLLYSTKEGHEAMVKLLLESGADVKAKNENNWTPLSLAAVEGHKAIVKLLLEKGAEANGEYNGGMPLSLAAAEGHKAIVKLLLEKGAEANGEYNGRTPLSFAAEEGHEAVVKLLLESGAKVEPKGKYDRTPLMSAAKEGHEEVIKLLLKRGANVRAYGGYYSQTPLSFAAREGHEAAVKLLLGGGADVEVYTGYKSQTPLSLAAEEGHEAVVKLLLENSANVEAESEDNWTPLMFAVRKGYEAVTKLLLESGADVEAKSKDNSTPLISAAKEGHEAVIKLLLSSGADVEAYGGSNSQTPLLFAAGRGHEAVVKLLLESGAKVEPKGKYDRTPLMSAAKEGHEEVIKLLLKRGANVRAYGGYYSQTPLSFAAKEGHEAAVKLLLESGANVEAKSKDNLTPLMSAAIKGHEATIKLLLERGADVEAYGGYNSQTPLSFAAREGNEAAVKLLLKNGANVEAKDNETGQTPLLWAATNGYEAVAKLLLDKGVFIEAKDDKYSRTSLSWAARDGHEEVARLLLANGASVNTGDNTLRTPLAHAARGGHGPVVRALLGHHSVEPDQKDIYGSTPLSIAVRHCHTEIVRMLLATGKVSLDLLDCFERTSWWWAKIYGDKETKQALLGYAEKTGKLGYAEEIGKLGYAEKLGKEADENDESIDGYLVCNSEGLRYCDICTLSIDKVEVYYRCNLCNGGDFDVCLKCYEIGGHCLGNDHGFVEIRVAPSEMTDASS